MIFVDTKIIKSKRFTKVKLLPVPSLLLDLEMFLDHKGYYFDNFINICIMVGALAVCETTEILIIKYQAEN